MDVYSSNQGATGTTIACPVESQNGLAGTWKNEVDRDIGYGDKHGVVSNSSFASIALSENGYHSLHWPKHGSVDYDWLFVFITTFPSAAEEGMVEGSEAEGWVMEGEEEGEREEGGTAEKLEVQRWQEVSRERDKRRGGEWEK